MKYATNRPYADPEAAARKLLETANTIEAIQDGRIHIEKITRSNAAGCGNTNPAPT
ncbi:hypothetical protein ACO2JO_04770 [Leptospira interrogans]